MDYEKYYEWTKIENPETDLPDYGETVLLKLKNGEYVVGVLKSVISYDYDIVITWIVNGHLINGAVAWMRIKPYGE